MTQRRTGGRARRAPLPEADGRGGGLIRATWAGTAALAAVAGLGLAVPGLVFITFLVSLALFVGGVAALLLAYVRAIGRSREDEITVAGLFFLAGTAPRRVQGQFFAAFLLQLIIGFAAAGAGINTLVATALLAPVYGLGLMGLWGARHGTFPDRVIRPSRRPAQR